MPYGGSFRTKPEIKGKPLVYFDNAATTQKRRQ
jgi:selenocysteine lyase/cysteine desulfurase